ncbi:unnamed protein product [Paramecium pentaurelia]|uniref:Histone H4 n=1 Tax=Paramecium pentaurelia TaxID=43138 RepID=A0A8S1SWN7_9CILI|nr:unnamed protein product [Paramecium pentaurelia]
MPPKVTPKSNTIKYRQNNQKLKGQGRNIDYKKFPQHTNKSKLISNGDIRRLARRGGVKRISSDVYELSKLYMKLYISNILRDSMIYANYSGRATILADDICRAAKRAGQTAIGFTH